MAFNSKFTVDGKDFNVLSCTYHLYQETDATGRPSSVTRGGKITVTIESTDDTTLFAWMTNSYDRKNGSVKFFKRDSESAIMKQVDFEEAYLVGFEETFSHNTESPMNLTITLSAKKMTIGSSFHLNEWV
jgi:hypothetical protein